MALLLALYLTPCAIQDWRSGHVSNWLTVPAWGGAWIAALYFNTLPLTIAVFAGCYIAWSFNGMGGADGKLATLMAALVPSALWVSGGLLVATFVVLRMLGRQDEKLPAVVAFGVGAWVAVLVL